MKFWLSNSILVIVVTIAGLAIFDSAACMFYLIPKGTATSQDVCRSPGERAAGTLSALLATLIGITTNPPKE